MQFQSNDVPLELCLRLRTWLLQNAATLPASLVKLSNSIKGLCWTKFSQDANEVLNFMVKSSILMIVEDKVIYNSEHPIFITPNQHILNSNDTQMVVWHRVCQWFSHRSELPSRASSLLNTIQQICNFKVPVDTAHVIKKLIELEYIEIVSPFVNGDYQIRYFPSSSVVKRPKRKQQEQEEFDFDILSSTEHNESSMKRRLVL